MLLVFSFFFFFGCSWWKDLNFRSTYSYSRDRIVEIYLWSVAQYYEPGYSRGRIIFTKIFMLLVVIDDTYDAYATLDELQRFTDAIERLGLNICICTVIVKEIKKILKLIFTHCKLYLFLGGILMRLVNCQII